MVTVTAQIDGLEGMWSWLKIIRFKKSLVWLMGKGKEEAIHVANKKLSPANSFKKLVRDELTSLSALDSLGVLHSIPMGAIQDAANTTQVQVNQVWVSCLQGRLWEGISDAELSTKVVDESWTWHWKINWSLQFSGGEISLSPGINDVIDWFDSISSNGFSSKLFSLQNATFTSFINANGSTAHGNFEAGLSMSIKYENEIIDPELGQTGSGHVDYGMGLYFALWF